MHPREAGKENVMSDLEHSDAFGELRGRVFAMESRLDRHENATTQAQRELRIEMTRSMTDLRSEMKAAFAEQTVGLRAVQASISGLRDAEERHRGQSSVLSAIGAASVALIAAFVGAMGSLWTMRH